MDSVTVPVALARDRLARQGWIAHRSESFRHLPPPALQVWMPDEPADAFDPAAALTDGWTVTQPVDARRDNVEVRWLDAADPGDRSEMLAGMAVPEGDEAAPFAWAHRALLRRALCLRIGPAPDGGKTWLHVARRSCAPVEAPLLRIELLDGADCVLLESHETSAGRAVVQNVHLDLRLGARALLQHTRLVTPAAGDSVAHHLQAQLAADASYEQALLASGSRYLLQRNVFALNGARSAATIGGVLLAKGCALEQQVHVHHAAPATRSAAEMLALASGAAHVVANAYTRMARGCDEAAARQRLDGIPTGGQPRIVLRPHLEIEHDQVQAAHGATWGALPEDALFHARQRGLDELSTKALIVGGLARAVLARAVDDSYREGPFRVDDALSAAVARHLGTEPRHG